MEKSSKLPDKEAVRDIENYLKAPNMEEKKVEFEQFMKKNKNFSSMEAKDKLHAWRIFAKAANANNQAFNLTRDWQKTHLLHLTKCLDNIKNGLPPPANHELAEMDLVKKNNIELSAYNQQSREFSCDYFPYPESAEDCKCMQCNPQRTDNDKHIVEALQNLDTPFPMRMLIELGGPMGGGEKVIGSQRGSAVYTAIEKMFNKAPGLTKGKPVHPKIKELYEKYGPLDMEQCLKKSGADLNFTAGRYKHHSEDKDKSSQIIGQYNVKEKKFEGFVRRISYNLVFEGVWSDDPSQLAFGRILRGTGLVQTGYFWREITHGLNVEQDMDFVVREQGFYRLGKLLCAMDLPQKGILGIPRNEPTTEELLMENQKQAFSIVKAHLDDDLKSVFDASEACEKKVDGLNLVNLHMANMEVLYPKWFNECLQHSKLGPLFDTARNNMHSSFVTQPKSKKVKVTSIRAQREQDEVLAKYVEEKKKEQKEAKPLNDSQGISRKAMTTWKRIGPISIETIIKANKEHGMPDIEFESDKVSFNKWTDLNGRLFEGQQNLKTKKADGIAKAYWDLGMFEGQCKDSEPHGFGRLINQHGMYYVGFFNMGARNGFGTEYNPDGSVFLKGTWKNNVFDESKK